MIAQGICDVAGRIVTKRGNNVISEPMKGDICNCKTVANYLVFYDEDGKITTTMCRKSFSKPETC